MKTVDGVLRVVEIEAIGKGYGTEDATEVVASPAAETAPVTPWFVRQLGDRAIIIQRTNAVAKIADDIAQPKDQAQTDYKILEHVSNINTDCDESQ